MIIEIDIPDEDIEYMTLHKISPNGIIISYIAKKREIEKQEAEIIRVEEIKIKIEELGTEEILKRIE